MPASGAAWRWATSTGCTPVSTRSGTRASRRKDAGWPLSLPAARAPFLSHLDAAVLWGFDDRHRAADPRHREMAAERRGPDPPPHPPPRPRRNDDKKRHPGDDRRAHLRRPDRCLSEDRLLRAMREAEYQRLLDLDSLNAAVERAHGRRRPKPLKHAIAMYRPGQSSAASSSTGSPSSGVARPPRARDERGRTARGTTYVLDCYWPETASPSSWTAATRTRASWPSSRTGVRTPPSLRSVCGPSASRGSA